MIKFPGLIDPHVHLREPGAVHKEDWQSGTAAALAGGFTTVFAMPNTQPSIIDQETFNQVEIAAKNKALCDYAHFLGAGPENTQTSQGLASNTIGLKMYLNQTFGTLRLDDMDLWAAHFRNWPKDKPIAIHAEGHTLAAAITFAAVYDRPIHLCHISLREEIHLIRDAKEQGLPITCEVTPHHLFLSEKDIPTIGAGRAEVRPILATEEDQQSLWDNLEYIDCFATDHAPHTLEEKDSQKPPPGFPGLETALPLLLTAIHAGRLTQEDIILRCYTNPRKIYKLPEQPETWIEVDPDARYQISAKNHFSRCGWTPFEDVPVQGSVERVIIRGEEVFHNGQILVKPGFGINISK
ncbi:MAG: amidohydrolase family protein [Anaerolineaceae bacterium]|nr:amidohydrolase family protein [Anaerolineaceae bacterium]